MRFKTSDYYAHWPFEGTNYVIDMKSGDLTMEIEVAMMDWLEERKISHFWSLEDITFKCESDRLMFILRFQ